MNDELDSELNASFVSDARQFNGEELAPYTEGSRLLMSQVRDPADSGLYFIWSFIYVHIQLKKDRKSMIKLAWNLDAFREAVIEFSLDKTTAQRDAAAKIVTSIIEEADKAHTGIAFTPSTGVPLGNG